MKFEEAVIEIFDFGQTLMNDSFEEPLSKCSEEMRNGFVEIFANQKSSTGDIWPPHSPVTIQLHGEHPLLILSGDLHEQLTSGTGISESSERRVSVGTDLEYADWNNDGTEKIPAREFMYIPEDAQNACVEHIGDYIFSFMPGEE